MSRKPTKFKEREESRVRTTVSYQIDIENVRLNKIKKSFISHGNTLDDIKVQKTPYALLTKIEKRDLMELWYSGKPYLILKINSSFFYTEIEKKMRIDFENDKHLCRDCKRLVAVSDEEGGCKKVRRYSRHIENFEFIAIGFETIGTESSEMGILKCNNFEHD